MILKYIREISTNSITIFNRHVYNQNENSIQNTRKITCEKNSKKNNMIITTGEKIMMSRKEKNLKQSELAELIGVTESTIVNYEFNKRFPGIKSLLRLSKALNVPVQYLIDDTMQIINYTSSKALSKMDIIKLECSSNRLFQSRIASKTHKLKCSLQKNSMKYLIKAY